MFAQYNPSDFVKAREWVRQHGGSLFPTFGAFQWFMRQHRDRLIRSGEVIARRGAGGTVVGPGFGALAVKIMQEESRGENDAA